MDDDAMDIVSNNNNDQKGRKKNDDGDNNKIALLPPPAHRTKTNKKKNWDINCSLFAYCNANLDAQHANLFVFLKFFFYFLACSQSLKIQIEGDPLT